MKKFFPIYNEYSNYFTALVEVSWRHNLLIADFVIHEENHWLRVQFGDVEIFRVLDEMPLSTEEDWESGAGWIEGHCAYRVEDAHFWLSQSEAFRLSFAACHHYQFLTSDMCLDVIASNAPKFLLVPARWSEAEAGS